MKFGLLKIIITIVVLVCGLILFLIINPGNIVKKGVVKHNVTKIGHSAAPKSFTEFKAKQFDLIRSRDVIFADSLTKLGKYEEALKYYHKAKVFSIKNKNWPEQIYIINKRIGIFLDTQSYDSALIYLKLSERTGKQKLEKSDPLIAEIYFLWGKYYDFTNDPENSIKYYLASLKLRKRLFGEKDLLVAEVYDGLGATYYYLLNDYINAEKYYKNVLSIRESMQDSSHVDLLRAYYIISIVNRQKHDYQNALIYSNKSLSLARKMPENIKKGKSYFVSLCLNLVANTYQELADYNKAIKYYQEAISLLESNTENKDSQVLSDYYNNLGLIYLSLKDLDNAGFFFKVGLDYELFGNSEDSYQASSSYFNLGLFYTSSKKYDSAYYFYNKCLNIRIKNDGKRGVNVANTYLDLGKLYEEQDSLQSALKYYHLALSSLVDVGSDVYSIPEIKKEEQYSYLIDIVIEKANILKKIYFAQSKSVKDLNASLEYFKLGNFLNDYSRNSLNLEDSKLALEDYYETDLAEGIEVAHLLFELTKDEKYLEQAFKFIEKNKYVLLYESLAEAEAYDKTGIPQMIKEQENNLIVRKNFLMQQIAFEEKMEKPDSAKLKNLEQQNFDVSRQYGLLKEKLLKDYPNYYRIRFDKSEIDIAQIKASLGNRTSIIEYYWGDSSIYIISISKDNVELVKLNRMEVENEIESYIELLSDKAVFTKTSFEKYKSSALFLYKKLLEPVLKNKNSEGNDPPELIIIPDGLLANISFEALLINAKKQQYIDFKNLDYLINHYKVSYAYSSNLYLRSKNTPMSRRVDKFLAFGFNDERKNKNSTNDLKGTSKELKTISLIVKGDYFTGAEATEDNFKKYSSQCNALHLALHGNAAPGTETQTQLIFRKKPSSKEDGILYPYELYNLNLKTQLVVLSACQTGIGQQYKGEGIYSMARGFAYAGCPSIVMSFWKVNDWATADLMEYFYYKLSDGEEINTAMRDAKLQYLENADEISAHPSNWASFVTLGETSPIDFPLKKNYWTELAIGLAGLSFIFLFIKKGFPNFLMNKK